MKKNKILLLITLILLLLSVSYAAEVSDDTASDDTPTNTVQTSTQSVEQSVIKEEQDNNKEIKKTATSNKTTKTAKKTYEVTDSNSLFEALCEDTYDTLTININENIEMDGMDFQENINKYMLTVDNEGKTLIIEGNGNTINGESTVIYFRFLTINSGSNVIIKNIKITNFDSRGAGAIDNYGNLRIINSTLNNNKAGYGGAIYNNEGGILTIVNTTFNNNKAAEGCETIYNKGRLYITDCSINKNTVIASGKEIYNEGTLNITINTLIAINKIAQKTYKQNMTINGKLTDSFGTILKNTNLKVKINSKTYTVKTNNNGVYTLKIVANKVGINNVTVTYPRSSNYNTSTVKTTFTVTKATPKVTITNITQKTYKQNMTITGKLTDSTGAILKNTNIKVKVNTKTYTVKTNSNGVYTVKVTANKVGTNNVTVTYAGNKNYKAVTKKTTFKTVARATKLTVNKISTTTKGKTVKITGKLTDNLKSPVMNSQVKIKVNTKTVSVKTNKQGVYTYNYKTTTKGTNNVTVTFSGSTNYKKISAKTSFKVK